MHICVRSPETGITDSCELPSGCWDLNLGPLEEQPMLLTAVYAAPGECCYTVHKRFSLQEKERTPSSCPLTPTCLTACNTFSGF